MNNDIDTFIIKFKFYLNIMYIRLFYIFGICGKNNSVCKIYLDDVVKFSKNIKLLNEN